MKLGWACMLKLLSLCEREGICFFWRPLDPDNQQLLGMYFRTPTGVPVIVLDESLINRIKTARTVLAEELAHYWTVPMVDHMNCRVDDPLTKVNVWRDESRALRLATNLLIPTVELVAALNKGVYSHHELSEYFMVEEYVVQRKMNLLRIDLHEQMKLREVSPYIAELFLGDMEQIEQNEAS